MKTYGVSIPVAGYIYIEIEAEDENDAKEKAFQSDIDIKDIEEWDVHEEICRGNVFHGNLNKILIEDLGEFE